MGEPLVRIEPWPTVEQPSHHIVVFTAPDVWWRSERPDLPGWLEVRVFEVQWEQRYETGTDVGGTSFRRGGGIVSLPGGVVVEFASDSMQWPLAPPPGPPLEMGFSYEHLDGHSSIDRTFDWTKARAEASGSVKWDGCVNYSIGLVDGCLAHACGPGEITAVAAALVRGVEIAYEIMEVE